MAVDPFAQDHYQTGDGNLNEPITVGRLRQPVRFGGGTTWESQGSSNSLSDRPDAISFGVGTWNVGKTTYKSDGKNWTETVPFRDIPLRVATFGDSTAGVDGDVTASQDTTFKTAPFPASGATPINFIQSKWDVQTRYPMAYLVANGGIAGQNTTQMLARDNAVASTTRKAITDVLNLYPDVVILRGGSINDIQTLTAAQLPAQIEITYANHIAIIERFTSSGVFVLDEGIFGFSVAGTYMTDVQAAIVTLNNRYRDYAKTNDKVLFISPDGLLSNNGAMVPEMTVDGVHLSSDGGHYLSILERDAFISLFGDSPNVRYKGVNLFPNPLFSSTSTTGQGVVATGVQIAASNATITDGKLETINGKIFNTFLITPSAANNLINFNIPIPVTTIGIVANDIFGIEVDFYLNGVNGAPPPVMTGFYNRADIYKTGAGRISLFGIVPILPVSFSDPSGYIPHISMQPLQITESSAALSASSILATNIITDSLKPFKVGLANPRLVKLGVSTVSL